MTDLTLLLVDAFCFAAWFINSITPQRVWGVLVILVYAALFGFCALAFVCNALGSDEA